MDEDIEPREKPIEIELYGDKMHRAHERDENCLKYEKSAHEAGTKKPARVRDSLRRLVRQAWALETKWVPAAL